MTEKICTGACGEPLPLDRFKQRYKVRPDGGRSLSINGRCFDCQRLHDKTTRKSRAKPKEMRRDGLGWQDQLYRMFFTLPPTA